MNEKKILAHGLQRREQKPGEEKGVEKEYEDKAVEKEVRTPAPIQMVPSR